MLTQNSVVRIIDDSCPTVAAKNRIVEQKARVGPRRENDQSAESETEESFTGPDWMMEALQEAEKRQAEMPAMAPPPVEIPKEGESRKDVMTVEDDETFRRRNLILIAIILVLVVALLAVIFY